MLRVAPALALAALAFTPMSATAQSPGAGVVFTGDFETDNILAQWNAQCLNTGFPSTATSKRGTVNLTARVVGQGKRAARFNLPGADVNNACELNHQRPIGLGTDDFYGLMFLFPKSWREPSPAGWGLSLAQFSYQGIHGAPVALLAHAHNIQLVIQTGLCQPITQENSNGCVYSSGAGGNVRPMIAVPAPLRLGVWHELIVRVHHVIDSSGVVEVWHRLKGQVRWQKRVSFRGHPTVQWTPELLQLTPDGVLTLSFSGTVDKIGAYRGPADFPVSVWQDGFVRATSFAAAAAALP